MLRLLRLECQLPFNIVALLPFSARSLSRLKAVEIKWRKKMWQAKKKKQQANKKLGADYV